jgi:hypothetical protein
VDHENRFGPLLIVAGFVNFLSTLVWSSRDVLRTVRQALDLVPPVLFLHVLLAFPDGRLKGRLVRSFVATAYVVAIALELVRMSAGATSGPSRARKHQVKVSIADAQARLHGRYPSIGSASSRDA